MGKTCDVCGDPLPSYWRGDTCEGPCLQQAREDAAQEREEWDDMDDDFEDI